MAFLRPVQVRAAADERARRLFATNLSEGGMFIRTPRPPAEGTVVTLALPTRSGEVPFARAEVTYAVAVDRAAGDQLPGFGVRFLELSAPASALLREVLGSAGRTLRPGGPALSPLEITGREEALARTWKSARVIEALPGRRRALGWVVAVVSLIGLALGYGLWRHRDGAEPPAAQQAPAGAPSTPGQRATRAHGARTRGSGALTQSGKATAGTTGRASRDVRPAGLRRSHI